MVFAVLEGQIGLKDMSRYNRARDSKDDRLSVDQGELLPIVYLDPRAFDTRDVMMLMLTLVCSEEVQKVTSRYHVE